jgi:Ca2+-dependent lipid-binding protein
MELRCRVIEARELPVMDLIGKSDPYCVLAIGSPPQTVRTLTIPCSLSPTWDAEFTFEILSYATDILTIQMYDEDVARDDEMGKLVLQVALLPPGRVVDAWYPLQPTRGCQQPGDIHIAVHAALRGAPRWRNAPFQPLILRLTIIEANDLPKMGPFGQADPYCIVNVGSSTELFRTSVKKNTLSPVWNESAVFGVTNPFFDALHIVMRDQDLTSDEDMATLDIPLARYGDLKPSDRWYPLVPFKGVPKGGNIRMLVQMGAAPPRTYREGTPGVVSREKKK